MVTEGERRHLLDVCRLAAAAAGVLIRSEWDTPREVEVKSDASLVTRVDRGAEAIIREMIGRHAPGTAILGEEEGLTEEATLEGGAHPLAGRGLCWYVDPVDGTTNLAHGFPWVAVSIAAVVDGVAEAGVVYNPVQRQEFSAVLGGGAWLDGSRALRVSRCGELSAALLATGFPPGTDNPMRFRNLSVATSLMGHCHALRRAGAASLDLAAVAAGWLDGFWEFGLKPWDTAAGWLLVTEAGGAVSLPDGSPFDPHQPAVVASNGLLQGSLGQLVTSAWEMAGSAGAAS